MDNFAMAPPVPENKKGMSLCPNFCTSMNCPSSCPSYCCALSSIVPSNQGGGIIETDNTVSTRPCPDVCSSYGPTNCPGQCTSSCCTGQTWNQPSISEPLAIPCLQRMPSMGMPSVDQYSMSQQFMGQPSMIQQPPISSLIAQPAVSQPMVGQMPTSFPGVDVSYQYGYPPFSADQMAHADSDLCASYCTNTASCTPAGLCPPSCCQK
ncbi:hypothetical protein RF11_10333 [Thelohanellus kitauei]|uniref:Uncharacterized protein n=1 Tax=Thelohanellus kitauei TaxID=669202 RepID=A0A0C2NHF0_THEKT|nr:hypothetical protein RF11_10333 [Thelohanellus kitauei]